MESDLFPTTWGTFSTVLLPIHQLPPGSQLATKDMAEAYHTNLLHHSQWPSTVVCLEGDSFTIDTALCFGVEPSTGMYGTVWNAAADILQFQGIRPIFSWVDDHLFFCIRKFLPKYNQQRKMWNTDIMLRGKHQDGGRIWFGDRTFEDGTLKEWNEDCVFPCGDLSDLSAQSTEDTLYTYNFDNFDTLS